MLEGRPLPLLDIERGLGLTCGAVVEPAPSPGAPAVEE